MRSYNSTKKRILEILQDQTWMDVPTLARKSGIRPVRRAYTYFVHLEDLGLLVRGYSASGKLHYRVTPRGLDRLEWLRSQTELQDATRPGIAGRTERCQSIAVPILVHCVEDADR